MPFISLDSCSDCVIISNIEDKAGQTIETCKCSGINLKYFEGLVHKRPVVALGHAHMAHSVWVPDDLNLDARENILICRLQTKGGKALEELSKTTMMRIEYISTEKIMVSRPVLVPLGNAPPSNG